MTEYQALILAIAALNFPLAAIGVATLLRGSRNDRTLKHVQDLVNSKTDVIKEELRSAKQQILYLETTIVGLQETIAMLGLRQKKDTHEPEH